MRSSCAGAFNAIAVKNKNHVSLYETYVPPLESQHYCVGSYGDLPLIVSKQCSKVGVFKGTDTGKVFINRKNIRATRGSPNPGYPLKNWYGPLSRCIK